MADYQFHRTTVYDQMGGVVRVARNVRITVTDPVTGNPAVGLKQNGQPVSWVTTDGNGSASWTVSSPSEVRITTPNGLSDVITSTTIVQATAENVATQVATDIANAVAPGAYSAAATSTATSVATSVATSIATDIAGSTAASVAASVARSDSHVLLDTDGVPYFDTTATGTQALLVDTDGVPFYT